MTKAQRRALAEHWGQLSLPADAHLDLDAVFGRAGPRILEIGFGMGDVLLDAARSHSGRDYVGIEVHEPGIGKVLAAAAAAGLSNLRLMRGDAAELLPALPAGSFDTIWILFPDPWPKKRHNKRRLIQPAFARDLVRLLRPGGHLELSTDWEDYAVQMIDVLDATEGLRNLAGPGSFESPQRTGPKSRFERRGLRLGHRITRLGYARAESSSRTAPVAHRRMPPPHPHGIQMIDRSLLESVKRIAATAAQRILEVYDSPFAVEHKSDDSPLTEADLAAHRVIVDGLMAETPDIPILSEESSALPFDTRRAWDRYWLVDPLDGTREFVSRNGEFTVNIALIERQRPVVGVVWIPVDGRCYFGASGHGAFRQPAGGEPEPISVRRLSPPSVSIAGSRSHGNPQTQAFIEKVAARFPDATTMAMGSSLKFCLVAEGAVDVYPRFGPTSEWDTAAAQCVVESAGGFVTDLSLAPLRYNTKESLLNPHFLVFGDREVDWAQYLGDRAP